MCAVEHRLPQETSAGGRVFTWALISGPEAWRDLVCVRLMSMLLFIHMFSAIPRPETMENISN